MCPREKCFVLWGHCQNLLDDPRITIFHLKIIKSQFIAKACFRNGHNFQRDKSSGEIHYNFDILFRQIF